MRNAVERFTINNNAENNVVVQNIWTRFRDLRFIALRARVGPSGLELNCHTHRKMTESLAENAVAVFEEEECGIYDGCCFSMDPHVQFGDYVSEQSAL